MSAKQRRFFSKGSRNTRRAIRTVYRRSAKIARRTYRKARSGGIKSWLPLTTDEHVSAAITGASAPIVMSYIRPYSDKWLSFLGDYKDEAATYAVGALANKFGSGLVKQVGQDYARLAVFSAANQFAAPMLSDMKGTGSSMSGQGIYL